LRYPHAVIALVAIHFALAFHAAWNLSPVWDEIVYPAAGYDLLTTGRIRTSVDHPPLGKALLALPLLVRGRSLRTAPAGAGSLESFRYGFDFVHRNRLPAKWMIFLPRLTNVLLSCLLALLLVGWARRVWNEEAGILALALYAFLPPVLARASLALLEMPMAFFMTAALLGAVTWRRTRGRRGLAVWGLAWTAALLTKVNALVLLPVFWLADAFPGESEKVGRFRRWLETGLVAFAALGVCELVLRGLGTSYWTSQLLARTNDLANARFPVYFHGTMRESALFYMAPWAWLIKTPMPVMILASAGWIHWRRAKPKEETFILLSCTFILTGLLAAGSRSIVATGQYFYLWPLLALISSAAACLSPAAEWSGLKLSRLKWGVKLLAASLAVSSLWVHPQYLAYFNILAGGSSHGYEWLGDSDQDWGQGLPALAQWMKREGVPQILLGYSGAGDPRVYGIHYQDVISPALVTAGYRGEIYSQWPGRVVLALGTKVVQTEGLVLGWLLKNRKPVQVVGGTFLIYDLTHDREALQWLGWFYQATRRPAQASGLPKA